jgi:hypothetical protein
MRNGHAATKGAEPAGFYDTLTTGEQKTWDEIFSKGYVPEQGSTGLWLAKKRTNPKAIPVGPANSLKDLLSRAKEDIASDAEFNNGVDGAGDQILLKEDHKGNTYLPGVEQIVDQQLKDAAFNEWTDKQAWKETNYESIRRRLKAS